MRGEALPIASITQRGVAGDRAWALRECTYGGLVSAQTWPAMLQLRVNRSKCGGVNLEVAESDGAPAEAFADHRVTSMPHREAPAFVNQHGAQRRSECFRPIVVNE
jgi:uncharacterized protein YcbX